MDDSSRSEILWLAAEFRDELARLTPDHPWYSTFAQAAEQAERMAEGSDPAAMLEAVRQRGSSRLH